MDEIILDDARCARQGGGAGNASGTDYSSPARFRSSGRKERRVEDIKKLVEEASALALVGAKDQAIRVRFDFDPSVQLVLADRVQIQQILLNLMRNSVEAMQGGMTAGACAVYGPR